MNLAYPVSTSPQPASGKSAQTAAKSHESRPSFSRASHFAAALAPVAVAVAGSLWAHSTAGMLVKFAVYAMFLFGVAIALAALYAAELSEPVEELALAEGRQ
jgi:hypothetical protein